MSACWHGTCGCELLREFLGQREGGGRQESSVVVVVGDELASLVMWLCSFVIRAGGGT